MSDRLNSRICISKKIGGTRVEIWFSNENDIRENIELLEKIAKRLPMEQNRIIAKGLWRETGDICKLDGRVTDKGHRIALSLLHHYPNATSNSEIMDECDLSKDDVYDYLSGRSGLMKEWFRKVGEGSWVLTTFGENNITRLVESLVK